MNQYHEESRINTEVPNKILVESVRSSVRYGPRIHGCLPQILPQFSCRGLCTSRYIRLNGFPQSKFSVISGLSVEVCTYKISSHSYEMTCFFLQSFPLVDDWLCHCLLFILSIISCTISDFDRTPLIFL